MTMTTAGVVDQPSLDRQIEQAEQNLAELRQKRMQEGSAEAAKLQRETNQYRAWQQEMRNAKNEWLSPDASDNDIRTLARKFAYAAGAAPFLCERILLLEREIMRLKADRH